MEGRYWPRSETVASLSGLLRLVRLTGVAWLPTSRLYAGLVTCLGSLSTLQLLLAVPEQLGDAGALALVVFHAVIFSAPALDNLFFKALRGSLDRLFADASRSYDYGCEVIEPMHHRLLERKTKRYSQMSVLLTCAILVFMLDKVASSLLGRYLFGERYLALCPMWYPPFLDRDHFLVGLAAYLLQLAVLLFASFSIFNTLSLAFVPYNHLTSEFLLLDCSLRHFSLRAAEMSAKKIPFSQATRVALTMSCQHHAYLFEYFNVIQPVMKLAYSMCYAIGLILLLCTGLALTSESTSLKLKFGVTTVVQFLFLYYISWFSQEVSEKGQAVSWLAYSLDWSALPPDCRSSLQLLLLGSQRPLLMRTDIGPVHLEGFAALLRAAYSYFNMIAVATRRNQ